MFDLDSFAAVHHPAIEFLGVLSTFAAVAVSLVFGYLAYRGRRTNFRAVAYDTIHFEPVDGGLQKRRIVVIAITNLGELPISISDDFFSVGLRFGKRSFSVIPADASPMSVETIYRTYPVTIEPRKTARIVICGRDSFVSDCRTLIRGGWLKSRLLSIRILTEDGVSRNAKISGALRPLIEGKSAAQTVVPIFEGVID